MQHLKLIGACLATVSILTVSWLLSQTRSPSMRSVPQRVDLSPGESTRFSLGSNVMEVAVPAGPEESCMIGTLQIRELNGSFATGPLERNGSVESLFVEDFNSDNNPDGLIVVRCGGSGSYVTLYAILSSSSGYFISQLPEPASSLRPGYQGHDQVLVKDGTIMRTFPTYVNSDSVRYDRQWSSSHLISEGKMPVKYQSDCNASPSGESLTLNYSVSARKWQRY